MWDMFEYKKFRELKDERYMMMEALDYVDRELTEAGLESEGWEKAYMHVVRARDHLVRLTEIVKEIKMRHARMATEAKPAE
jgi:hypothetical protein